MICESLLSSFSDFSDSYFQGLLPAQNQFCRRIRKDAGFLTCPPFASALSANPAPQSGKHQRAAACCIQFGTGPAGRGKYVAASFFLVGHRQQTAIFNAGVIVGAVNHVVLLAGAKLLNEVVVTGVDLLVDIRPIFCTGQRDRLANRVSQITGATFRVTVQLDGDRSLRNLVAVRVLPFSSTQNFWMVSSLRSLGIYSSCDELYL